MDDNEKETRKPKVYIMGQELPAKVKHTVDAEGRKHYVMEVETGYLFGKLGN